ncbi:MAG: hypothetical protein DRO06_03535, partial [Thermoproteota archaeon]
MRETSGRLSEVIWRICRTAISLASGRSALDLTWRISRFPRPPGSISYSEAMDEVRGYLEEAGADVRILPLPADSEILDGLSSPRAWDVRDGELWMEEPERVKIASLDEVPTLVVFGSSPTRGWVEGEVSLEPRPGAILLTDDHPAESHERAVSSGVLATIHYSHEAPEGAFPLFRLPPYSEPGVALSISRAWASRIVRMVSGGERVVLRLRVNSGRMDCGADVLEAVLPGRSEGFVTVFSHLDGAGAVDNASGVASAVEALRIVSKMAEAGGLDLGLRLVVGPEFLEAAAASAWGLAGRASLVVDSPASREVSISSVSVGHPSFVPILAFSTAEAVSETLGFWRVRYGPVLHPDSSALSVPHGAVVGSSPTAGTSADSPSVVSPRGLSSAAAAVASFALIACRLPSLDRDVVRILGIQARRLALLEALRVSQGEAPAERAPLIPQAYQEALRTLSALDPSLSQRAEYEASSLRADLVSVSSGPPPAPGGPVLARARGPVFDYLIVASVAPEGWRRACLERGPALGEIYSLFDGERTLSEVKRIVVADSLAEGGEFGEIVRFMVERGWLVEAGVR